MTHKYLIYRSLIIFGLVLGSLSLFGQDVDAGKTIFRANCASCHAGDMKTKLTGPALGGAEERWADYGGQEALYSWIRNSQAMIAGGENERAKQLWGEWSPVVMTSFLNLSDADIENVLAYVQFVYEGKDKVAVADGVAGGPSGSEPTNNTPLFIGLALALGLLALILARVVSNLNYMVKVKETGEMVQRRTLLEVLTSRGIISFVVFALVVLGGYTTVNNAINLGRQQGYEPSQPIKFSHKTHAGLQQIDCQYCHDGARRSKHSVIPAANTCMNCHKAIKNGSQYGTAELTKIYASVGYDPSTDKYITGYDQMSQEDQEAIYKKWIADQYVSTTGGMDDDGEQLIEDQWEAIVTALTNEETGDDKIAGPIEWVRIHNLPDHAYFNHAQHVSVGKVECQTCHGQVQEMEVVYQYSPLSMGWCINCHRQTEVQFAGNEYYDAYENYHKEIQAGTRSKVTVEEIGGLECQKCHY
ncbi:MAG: cytochrome c class I [Bacteroidetes bacterium]|nr:MAG: cytochrome c class I [Bacteroidota bacterium]PTM13597.1 MAG: cytochrome c class I [Bacteroidota bacterium]